MKTARAAYCYDNDGRYVGQVPAQDCDRNGVPKYLPAGAVGFTGESPSALRAPVWNGAAWEHGQTEAQYFAALPDAMLAGREREWRDAELARADVEVRKVQDGNGKSRGTLAAWSAYRNALRDMPAAPGFPRSHTRPEAPQ